MKKIISIIIAIAILFTAIPTVTADEIPFPVMPGDVNGNSKIEIHDIVEILLYIASDPASILSFVDKEGNQKEGIEAKRTERAWQAVYALSECPSCAYFEIFKYLAKMDSVVDGTGPVDCYCETCEICKKNMTFIITISNGQKIIEYYCFRRLGDVDHTGDVTVEDAIEILCYLAELPSVIATNKYARNAALIVNNGVPKITDAIEILKFLAELPSVFDIALERNSP